jgi:hypothetical protein
MIPMPKLSNFAKLSGTYKSSKVFYSKKLKIKLKNISDLTGCCINEGD